MGGNLQYYTDPEGHTFSMTPDDAAKAGYTPTKKPKRSGRTVLVEIPEEEAQVRGLTPVEMEAKAMEGAPETKAMSGPPATKGG